MTTTTPAYVAASSVHQRLRWLGDSTLQVLLDAATTGGQLGLVRATLPQGSATPWHVHGREDEILLMLDGKATVWIGEDHTELESGGVAFMPRDVPHGFRIDSTTADVLNMSTPGGLENFFRTAGHDLSTPIPDGWALTPQALGAAMAEHGGTILGPPRS